MRCPVCKAEPGAGAQCRRCRADLSLLLSLQAQRTRHLAAASDCLKRGDYQQAEKWACDAESLSPGADVSRLLAVCRLLQRDFAGAWRVYADAISTRDLENP